MAKNITEIVTKYQTTDPTNGVQWAAAGQPQCQLRKTRSRCGQSSEARTQNSPHDSGQSST